MFRTSLPFSLHIPDITVYIPDSTVLVSDITVLIPDIIVHILDIIISLLSTFWTSKVDVRNMDSILCPSPGHQRLMSGIWPVETGHIPDIDLDVRNVARIFGPIPDIPGPVPDIAGRIPDITGHVPDIAGHVPDINFHEFLKAGLVPDIVQRCPEHGQETLVIFRT